ETPQVFVSVEQGFYSYKESNGQAVLDNGREEISLSENWQEEKELLQSLYEILAKKNLQVQDTISIQKLYYGFDKFHLSATAVADLEKIAEVMTTNPEINVELKAYTDSRGPLNYNKELAKKRVFSAYQYLVKKGVSPNRIIQTPVGEAGAVKDC